MSLTGKKVVFTGFRDIELKKQIHDKKGVVTTGISKSTDIVVYDGEKGENSDKKKKGEAMGKIVMNKSEFIKKYISQKKGFWEQFFAMSTKPKVIVPDYDQESIITETKGYLVHDNGGRPFAVQLKPNKTFAVYKQSQIAEKGKGWTVFTGPYDKEVIKPTKYVRVFIGRCPEYGEKFDGNTVLVQVSAKQYIYIGETIYKTTIDDEIIGYKSPIVGSDVAYAYAYGKLNTYLFLEQTFIPNETLTRKDPYEQFYGHHLKIAMATRQKLSKEHKKNHPLKDLKVIHKRL